MAEAVRPFTILVVDDSEDITNLVELTLRKDYRVLVAQDGRTALRQAFGKPRPDLILLDVEMPGSSGYDVCKALKASPAIAEVPVIFMTHRAEAQDVVQGFQLGAVDYFTKPIVPTVLAARVRAHAELISHRHRQEDLIRERSTQLEQTRQQLIRRLGRAMEYHESSAVGNRVVRLGHYARALSEAAGARPQMCDLMMKAAPLHDIGKLGVPANVLRKAGRLDAPEWEQMRRHPTIGADIIGEHDDPLLKLARTLALTHHERWDGSGYPAGAKGADIPWAGRVMAVVDSFESMTATQFHRQPMPIELAINEVTSGAGTRYDPAMVEAFKKALPEFRKIRDTYADSLGDMLDLDFVVSHPAPAEPPSNPSLAAPAKAGPSIEEQAEIEARAVQATRAADEARAKALAEQQARLKVERDLTAAASRDIASQQSAIKRAEQQAARDAELAELSKRRAGEESVAARLAKERAQAEEKAAAAAREAEQARRAEAAKAQERAEAENALADAAAARRESEEALAKAAAEQAEADSRMAEIARRRAEEEAGARQAAEARAKAEADAARAAQLAQAAKEKAATEAAARAKAEESLAAAAVAAEKRRAEEEAKAREAAEERLRLEREALEEAKSVEGAKDRAIADAQERLRAEKAATAAAAERVVALEAAERKAKELAALEVKAAGQAKARADTEAAALAAEKRKGEEESRAREAAEQRQESEAQLARVAKETNDARAKALADAQARLKAEEALAFAATEKAKLEEESRLKAELAAKAEAKAVEAAKQRADADARAADEARQRMAAEAEAKKLGAEKGDLEAARKAREREWAAVSPKGANRPAAPAAPKPPNRALVYLGLLVAVAVAAAVFYPQFQEPVPPPAPRASVPPPTPIRAAEPKPIPEFIEGEPVKLRMEADLERLATRLPPEASKPPAEEARGEVAPKDAAPAAAGAKGGN